MSNRLYLVHFALLIFLTLYSFFSFGEYSYSLQTHQTRLDNDYDRLHDLLSDHSEVDCFQVSFDCEEVLPVVDLVKSIHEMIANLDQATFNHPGRMIKETHLKEQFIKMKEFNKNISEIFSRLNIQEQILNSINVNFLESIIELQRMINPQSFQEDVNGWLK